MMKYIVKGSDESVENVDILGEVRKVGDVVVLDERDAAPLVEEGKLEVFERGEGDQNDNVESEPGEDTGGDAEVPPAGEGEGTV